MKATFIGPAVPFTGSATIHNATEPETVLGEGGKAKLEMLIQEIARRYGWDRARDYDKIFQVLCRENPHLVGIKH